MNVVQKNVEDERVLKSESVRKERWVVDTTTPTNF